MLWAFCGQWLWDMTDGFLRQENRPPCPSHKRPLLNHPPPPPKGASGHQLARGGGGSKPGVGAPAGYHYHLFILLNFSCAATQQKTSKASFLLPGLPAMLNSPRRDVVRSSARADPCTPLFWGCSHRIPEGCMYATQASICKESVHEVPQRTATGMN